jgi:hypothetical protein
MSIDGIVPISPKMKTIRNRSFIITLDREQLTLVDLLTLTVLHAQACLLASSLTCDEDHAYIGFSDGVVLALNLHSLVEARITNLAAPVSALFCGDGLLYCGNEDGAIHIYSIREEEAAHISSTLMGSLTESEDDPRTGPHAVFRLVKSMRHPAPITQICSDGAEMLVADMRNKVTVYPAGRTYDMKSPALRHKNYVFASEKNMLYCKTKEAFAVYLGLKSTISNYVFSRNGGVLFVQCGAKVTVVNFNERTTIREMKIEGSFVFDDDRNRIVWMDGDVPQAAENVLDREYEEMDRIRFREDKMVEKRVRGYEDKEADEQASCLVNDGGKKEVPKKRHIGSRHARGPDEEKMGRLSINKHRGAGDRSPVSRPKKPSTSHHRSGEFSSSESSLNSGTNPRMVESSEEEGPLLARAFVPSSVETPEANLLCYTADGFMLSVMQRIEVNFHENTRPKIEISNVHGCRMGAFCGDKVVLCNDSRLFFHSPEAKWEKEMRARTVAVTEKMVVVVDDELRVFEPGGTEIFNCLIPCIHTLCCHGTTIAVFCNELVLIDLLHKTERFMLPARVSFACFDECGRLFYKIEGGLFHLYKGLSVKLCAMSEHPLLVHRRNVVSLAESLRLLPSPHINYTRVLDGAPGALLLGVEDNESEEVNEDCALKHKPEKPLSTVRYNPFSK